MTKKRNESIINDTPPAFPIDALENDRLLDNEIKKRVQSIECNIPAHLEADFISQLDQVPPSDLQTKKKRVILLGMLATAASIILTVLLYVLTTSGPSTVGIPLTGNTAEQSVYIDSAKLDGSPASTYIVGSDDPDITIVWIEKDL